MMIRQTRRDTQSRRRRCNFGYAHHDHHQRVLSAASLQWHLFGRQRRRCVLLGDLLRVIGHVLDHGSDVDEPRDEHLA